MVVCTHCTGFRKRPHLTIGAYLHHQVCEGDTEWDRKKRQQHVVKACLKTYVMYTERLRNKENVNLGSG